MPESGLSGSVRGAPSNGRPYRDQAFRDRIVARLLPPESAAIEVVSREVGVSVGTLERLGAQALWARRGPQNTLRPEINLPARPFRLSHLRKK